MVETNNDTLEPGAVEPESPPEPRPKAPPIESRFLFVDIAAMRAKQLRRGARPRLEEFDTGERHRLPLKPERIAMEEVRRNLVLYSLPGTQPAGGEPEAGG
jgi:DNA-directed RNA polymerase subunit K/omega